MESLIFARVVHVLGVVLWIGGVAMVTTVLLPAVRSLASAEERVALFEKVEHRFAGQARLTTLVTGLSGFYLLHRLDGWDRFQQAQFWWVTLMTLVWLVFTLMLFVLEPLFLHRWFAARARRAPESTFALVQRLHWLLLAVSLAAVAGAVAGAHGWAF